MVHAQRGGGLVGVGIFPSHSFVVGLGVYSLLPVVGCLGFLVGFLSSELGFCEYFPRFYCVGLPQCVSATIYRLVLFGWLLGLRRRNKMSSITILIIFFFPKKLEAICVVVVLFCVLSSSTFLEII